MFLSLMLIALVPLVALMTVVLMLVRIFWSFVDGLSLLQPNCLLRRISDEFSEAIDGSRSSDSHKSHSQPDGQPNTSVTAVSLLSSLEVIAAQAADAGRCRPFSRAVGGGAGSERDIEVQIVACEADESAGGDLAHCEVLFERDVLCSLWGDIVLLGQNARSVVFSLGELGEIVGEGVVVRFPRNLSRDSRVSSVEDGELVVLAGVGAPGHSEVGGTAGHSHHVSVDEVVEVDIDDLLAEVVLDQADQLVQAGVGGDVDDVRGASCDLQQLRGVDVAANTHAEQDDPVGPRKVGSVEDRVLRLTVSQNNQDLRDSVREIGISDKLNRSIDSETSVCGACPV